MRVTSDLFVSALLRRTFSAGGFAAIVSRGATEAGAIFLIERNRLGEMRLYGPAPQTLYEGTIDDRLFVMLPEADQQAVDARLERERRFDSDIWVVEIEPSGTGLAGLVSIREG